MAYLTRSLGDNEDGGQPSHEPSETAEYHFGHRVLASLALDCSVAGYETFLAAIADPRHEQHAELRDWIGYPFDPYSFDLNAINQRLAQITR